LPVQDRGRVRHHVENYFDKLPQDRRLANGRCTSPVRSRSKEQGNVFAGGGYESQSHAQYPTLYPPQRTNQMSREEHATQLTSHATQPFRGRRQQ